MEMATSSSDGMWMATYLLIRKSGASHLRPNKSWGWSSDQEGWDATPSLHSLSLFLSLSLSLPLSLSPSKEMRMATPSSNEMGVATYLLLGSTGAGHLHLTRVMDTR